MAEEQKPLRIGDTVLFTMKIKETKGYVCSELSSTAYNFLTVKPIQEIRGCPYFTDVSYATFTILAPNKYKAKQHLKELEQRNGEEYQILNAKRALESENAENAIEQKRRFGSRVFYGDSIQLQHTGSKKFVHVCSEASKTESNNLLINLTDENAEGCIFKLLPRYKVRSEGDEIRLGDQLKIESSKTQGQFLHCSRNTVGQARFSVLTECFELNLSATESGLTLEHHHCPSSEEDQVKAIKAGKYVRLFHKEDECYIVAEGSFAEEKPVVEDVHCRMRRVDSRKHSNPSTSANTYWQIEKEEDSKSGDVISWGERIRFKHLPTRRYLAVVRQDEKYMVILKERSVDDNDLDTIFSLSPLIEEGESVTLESYAHIKHLYSKQWLHLETKNVYTKKNFNSEAKGLAGLQWDSAELFMLTTSEDKGDYDSFTLQEVTEDLIDRFNYVAGIVPVLEACNKIIHSGSDIRGKQAIRIRDTLIELREWIVTDDERDTKNNQKLLRNLRVLEQLREILTVGNEAVANSKHFIIDICRECYNVIQKFLEGDSRKNENYLARFIEFFQTQVRKGLNAEEVLVEIVQDNLTIISTMAETQMGQMIKEFNKTEDPRFLDFLGSLCVCSDRPIPSTQTRLLNEFVLADGRNAFLQTKIEKNEKDEETVFVYDPQSDSKICIKKIESDTVIRSKNDNHKNVFELLEAQLHLFAKLCRGNNRSAIDALVYVDPGNTDGFISFEEAFICVQDPDIHTTIRSRYIELILVMFVDVGENRSFIDHLCYSFIYDELSPLPYADTGDDETVALTGAENLYFPRLKVWILDTLDRNSEINCVSELAEENSLLVQVLDMLSHLVRFGYYDDIDDVNDVMVILIKLLDGTTDKPSPAIAASAVDLDEFKKKGRKLDNSENKSVFEVKCKALEVMNLFFRFKFYVKLQKFIHDFKVLYEALQTGRRQEREETDPPQDLTPLIEADHEHPQDWIFSNRMISIVRDRIKFLCDGSSKGSGFAPSNNEISSLESVLLDLSEYECDELVTSSLDLLTQMYFFEEELFYKAHQGQLLTSPESLMDYQKVNDDILPKLRQLLRIDANKNNQKRIVEFLDTLSGMCILPFNNDSGVPTNRQNQIMLDNFGIVSEIVSYVLSQGSHEQSTTESSVAVGDNVFRACFCFLRHIATDNPTVQKRLFNRFDDLFEIKFPTLSLAALADLMTEVFTGGPELILRVTESHIETIFEMIVHSNDTSIQAHFMMALEAIAKIEEFDLPVSRNQHLIIKNFCRLRDSFCQELLGQSPESEQMRFDILKAEDTQAPDSQLQLLLGVVDMLAACAEGKNLFIESVCQNILSIDEVVTIISSEALLPQRKKPFVRFLLFVYLITEEDQQNNQGTALTHGEVMWTYLAHLSSILEGVARVLDTVPQGLIENIRNELSSAASRRKTFSAAKGEHRPLSTGGGPVMSRITSVNPVPGVTDENGVLYPDMLEYLADGIIPLLHTYYSFYFDPNSLSKVEERQAEFDISSDIAKSLVHLGKELVKVFSSKKHIEMYQETLNILLSYDKIRETANIHDQQTDALQATIATAPAPVRKLSSYRVRTLRASFDTDGNEATVIENYNKQEQLNDLFNNYSRNYHLSYMGPNTARHQIGSPVSDHIEYSDEGEELPLGPSFQNLVQLYVDYDTIVKDYVEGLLYQLETSSNKKGQLGEAEQVEQDILDVRCLQVLRALIHNCIKLIDPELKDRDAIKFRQKSDALIVPIQNRIQSFGNAIKRVIPFLSHPNESISREALALMKVLLFSGNEDVQEGLINCVQETREETLFLRLKSRLEQTGITYKETIDIKSQLLERKKAQIEKKKEAALVATNATFSPTLSRGYSRKASLFSGLEPIVEHSNGKEVAISMEVFNKSDTLGDSVPLIIANEGTIQAGRSQGAAPSESDDALEDKSSDESSLLTSQLQANSNWTNLVLEVIGFMCDGQHTKLQDYLREQPDNFKTVNVVAEVTTLLHTYTGDLVHDDNLSQVHEILRSLIEMCVGNTKNQQVIFDKLVVDPLNRIFQLPLENTHRDCAFKETATDKCPECIRLLNIINIKGGAVELLEVMLENTSQDTQKVAEGIGSSLDVDSVLQTMQLFYDLQSHPIVKKNQMDDDCERGMFRAYQSIVSLIDYGAIKITDKRDLSKKAEELKCKDSYNAADHSAHSIEIHFKEEGTKSVLAKVNFPYPQENLLREEVTELVRWSANRDSMEDKQRSLLDVMPALKKDVRHQALLKSTKILKPFLAFHKWRARLLLLLTIILNIIVLAVFKVPPQYIVPNGPSDNNTVFLPETEVWFYPYLLFVLGAIHLIMTLWIVIEYFLINFPHFHLPLFFIKFCVTIVNYFLKKRGHNLISLPNITCLGVNIFGVSTLYMIILVACSILSLIFRGYFYCLCLLFVVVDNDILKRVLRAVTRNGIALIWVGILGMIVLFIYAVISFAFLHNEFVGDLLYCTSLVECSYTVLRLGLLDSLGTAIPFSIVNFDLTANVSRLIFDLSFFIIVTTIGLNIVFGIIVDSFGELREERSNIEAEQKSKCFICDLPSYDFERRAEGFQNHVNRDHNMWDYVYYSLYIDSIDTGDHNAIQKYVHELIIDNDTGFFPQEEAICLTGEEDDTGEKLEELQGKVESILQQFRDKEYAKILQAKKQKQKEWEEKVYKQQPLQMLSPQMSMHMSPQQEHYY